MVTRLLTRAALKATFAAAIGDATIPSRDREGAGVPSPMRLGQTTASARRSGLGRDIALPLRLCAIPVGADLCVCPANVDWAGA